MKGLEREALYELSQDPEAIAIYAGEIDPCQTPVNVAGRVITKFLFKGRMRMRRKPTRRRNKLAV